jgi:hypothetical protein
MATCYKAFRSSLLPSLDLQAQRFELCAELTAKLCRLSVPIIEVPISYHPRSFAEGKKISCRDAWEAIVTLLRWRFAKVPMCREDLTPARIAERAAFAQPETFSAFDLAFASAEPDRPF